MTVLVQILLPLLDRSGARLPREHFDRVRTELTNEFGGATAYLRAPAVGLWSDEDGTVRRDEIVIIEALADRLDAAWWKAYRATLESRFDQEEILIRASECVRL
jgi:hypothetical protein